MEIEAISGCLNDHGYKNRIDHRLTPARVLLGNDLAVCINNDQIHLEDYGNKMTGLSFRAALADPDSLGDLMSAIDRHRSIVWASNPIVRAFQCCLFEAGVKSQTYECGNALWVEGTPIGFIKMADNRLTIQFRHLKTSIDLNDPEAITKMIWAIGELRRECTDN